MPRPLWSGSLSFGLVNVPVVLMSAIRDLDLHFHQLHKKDGAPVEVQRWCSKEDVEVPYDEITHSYDEDGEPVIVTDLELEAISLAGRARSTSNSSSTWNPSIRSTSIIPICCCRPPRTTAQSAHTACWPR